MARNLHNNYYLHLGHFVLLKIARMLQELGGIVFIVIADFSAKYQGYTFKKIKYQKLIKKQISKILKMNLTKIVYQSEWTDKINLEKFIFIASHCDLNQFLPATKNNSIIESEKFFPISRFIYLTTGAYDSIVFDSEVEIAGIDQESIIKNSRSLQQRYGKPKEIGILLQHLDGIDGEKMGKSRDNSICISIMVLSIRTKMGRNLRCISLQ